MGKAKDIEILRKLGEQYAAVARDPIQEEKRALWSAHFALKPTRPLVLATFGMHNVWCREVFDWENMECEDPFYREHERNLRMQLFWADEGDDAIMEPWFTQAASVKGRWGSLWGVQEGRHESPDEGGSWKFDPPLKEWADLDKLKATPHEVDETVTEENVSKLHDALGDILPIDVPRTPSLYGFMSDISTCLARVRGLEQIMMDMYLYPRELKELLAFMRDGILANNQQAEEAGHFSLTVQRNQAMVYSENLEAPAPNSGPRKRKELWNFAAAQEFTLISPEFHEEFMLAYQKPIYDQYGLIHYGCCEDLTKKIDMLRPLKNLRSIAVTPTADVASCAEQIGMDYAISWRPNPTDMICTAWSEERVRRIIGAGLEACQGQYVHIHLKDVETVQGEPERMKNWVALVREIIDEKWK